MLKSLFKTVSLIVVFSVITRALGFVFRIYLSRSLGAELLGVYQAAFSIFIVLLTIISSGIPLVVSRLSAKYIAQKNVNSERKMLSCALVISLISSIALCAIILIFNKVFALAFADARCIKVLLMLLPALVFSAIYSTFRGSLWGHNQYFGVCVTELFEQMTRVFFCVVMIDLLCVNLDKSISTALSLCIASALSAILVMIMYFAKGKKLGKPKNHYREIMKISTPITGVRIASSLLQPFISIIIPIRLIAAGYTSGQAMGQLGIATGMTMPLLFIPIALIGALAMALIPDLAAAVIKKNDEHITSRVSSAITFTAFVSCLFIPLYIGAGEYIGEFFFNNTQSGVLLQTAAWTMLPLGLTNITSSILNALGQEMKSLKNYIGGAMLFVIGLIFLPKLIGVRSIFVSFGICVASASLLNLIMLKKCHLKHAPVFKPIIYMLLFVIPSAAITSFLSSILSHFVPLFFNLAISCSIGALFFVLLCAIFKVVNFSGYIIELKKSFKLKRNKRLRV